jgi:hypothetical protein
MKASIKKLRTCAYNKAVAPSGFTGQSLQHTNKLVCDHPEMKNEWVEKTCEKCTVYSNRNVIPEPLPPPAPEPAPEPPPQLWPSKKFEAAKQNRSNKVTKKPHGFVISN